MISIQEFIIRARVEHEALEGWITQLIRDLRDDLGVNDEGISVILHLLDQVHGLRRSMHHLVNEMRTGRPETGE